MIGTIMDMVEDVSEHEGTYLKYVPETDTLYLKTGTGGHLFPLDVPEMKTSDDVIDFMEHMVSHYWVDRPQLGELVAMLSHIRKTKSDTSTEEGK